jgi:hypothetical protein
VSKASIMLWLSVATNNTLCFQFNPRQKLNIILIIILANGCEFWQRHLQLRVVVRIATLSKLALAASGYMPQAMNSSTAS